MYFVTRSKFAFMTNLLKCNSDFRKKSRVAASRLALCGTGTGIGTAVWMCRIHGWVIGLVCSGRSTSSTRRGRIQFLSWWFLMLLFPNDFGEDLLLICVCTAHVTVCSPVVSSRFWSIMRLCLSYFVCLGGHFSERNIATLTGFGVLAVNTL